MPFDQILHRRCPTVILLLAAIAAGCASTTPMPATPTGPPAGEEPWTEEQLDELTGILARRLAGTPELLERLADTLPQTELATQEELATLRREVEVEIQVMKDLFRQLRLDLASAGGAAGGDRDVVPQPPPPRADATDVLERRIRQLERELDQLELLLQRLDNRLDRIELRR